MNFRISAVALASVAFQAHAANISYTSPTGSSFNDTFNLSLTSPSSVTGLGEVLAGTGVFSSTLYEALPGADTKVGFFIFGGDSPASGTKTFANLGAGDYYFNVVGFGLPSTSYSFSATTLSVPEPESYAMAGIGLAAAVVGWRQRKKKNDPA